MPQPGSPISPSVHISQSPHEARQVPSEKESPRMNCERGQQGRVGRGLQQAGEQQFLQEEAGPQGSKCASLSASCPDTNPARQGAGARHDSRARLPQQQRGRGTHLGVLVALACRTAGITGRARRNQCAAAGRAQAGEPEQCCRAATPPAGFWPPSIRGRSRHAICWMPHEWANAPLTGMVAQRV